MVLEISQSVLCDFEFELNSDSGSSFEKRELNENREIGNGRRHQRRDVVNDTIGILRESGQKFQMLGVRGIREPDLRVEGVSDLEHIARACSRAGLIFTDLRRRFQIGHYDTLVAWLTSVRLLNGCVDNERLCFRAIRVHEQFPLVHTHEVRS